MTRRRDKRIWFVALGVFVTVFLFTFLAGRFEASEEKVEAASLANFDPGYIISDYQMGNFNSMTESEIQAFLTKKNPCSNTDYNYYLQLSANKNYKWHFKDGHFVCLSEELFGDGEIIGEGETAAHIIWQAAQDYRINPQVLIVLIQKESSLITDPIPNNKNYRAATGYGCPDTAPCSTEYYGFKNQVRKAAALFRSVLDGGWTNYPLGNNYIQYNPNASCGGSIVNIKSLATSALYRYTPYQPNAGAIAAGYGSATCGAYGNRNFYLYFEDWFGGVTVEKIDTSLTEQNKNDKVKWKLLKAMLVEKNPELDVGFYDVSFDDNDELTRSEIISVLWELFGSEIVGDGVFNDMIGCDFLGRAAVAWAYAEGITKYYTKEGEFAPYNNITRREVMIFLWRNAGEPVVDVAKAKNELSDFPPDADELGQQAIAWAYEKGITKYYRQEGEIAPYNNITRREVMIFLWRNAGEPVVGDDIFEDMPEDYVSRLAIMWAYNNGITKYYTKEGEFAPEVVATRNELVLFINRAFSQAGSQ